MFIVTVAAGKKPCVLVYRFLKWTCEPRAFKSFFALRSVPERSCQVKKDLAPYTHVYAKSRSSTSLAGDGVWPERNSVTRRQFCVVLVVVFLGSVVGGVLGERLFSTGSAQAQKANVVNAEEFLLLDQSGKARAGLGLDANGEVGFVLTSKDGSRTLTLSPDDPKTIKLTERGGRILWAVP